MRPLSLRLCDRRNHGPIPYPSLTSQGLQPLTNLIDERAPYRRRKLAAASLQGMTSILQSHARPARELQLNAEYRFRTCHKRHLQLVLHRYRSAPIVGFPVRLTVGVERAV